MIWSLSTFPTRQPQILTGFILSSFLKKCRRSLKDGGVLVTGITSSVNYLGKEVGMYASSLYHTLKMVFPYIVVAPGTENIFFATSKPNVITSTSAVLSRAI